MVLVATQWAQVLDKAIAEPGYRFTSADIMEMSLAVEHTIGINQYATCGKYSVQNIAKCLANLLPALFRSKPGSYDSDLHVFIKRRQSDGSFWHMADKLGIDDFDDMV